MWRFSYDILCNSVLLKLLISVTEIEMSTKTVVDMEDNQTVLYHPSRYINWQNNHRAAGKICGDRPYIYTQGTTNYWDVELGNN